MTRKYVNMVFTFMGWEWNNISMNFITYLWSHIVKKNDSIWVIWDGLMKTTHILPMEDNDMLEVMQIIGWDKRFQFDKSGEEVTLGTVKEVYVWRLFLYFHKVGN